MAKHKNLLDSQPLRLSVSPEMHEDLESLVKAARGRYGKNAAEAAERLLSERLSEIVKEGLYLPPQGPGT